MFLTPLVVLLPILWLIPLLPSGWADRHTGLLRRVVTALVALLLVVSIVAGATLAVSGGATHRTLLTTDWFPACSLTVQIDAISALMLVLVSFVGWQVCQFSIRYLDGDSHQGRYFRWAGFVIASVAGMVLAGSVLWLAAAWVATSLGLHQLLLHYRERPAARRAAWTKFAVSRLGDVCLFAAVMIVGQRYQSLQFNELFALAGTLESSWVDGLIAALLVVAAMTKSAQFPLHAWLPETMETPTPVSALMHAGVVNAGGYLMLRTSPLMVQSPAAMTGLAIVGGITAVYAAVVMLTQTSVKKTLAYSTVAQMGFMILQCGLGAFSAAMVHLLTHSLYKAHAFLASGSVLKDEQAMASVAGATDVPGTPRMPTAIAASISMAIAGTALAIAALGWGVAVQTKPGGVLLAGILGIGLARWLTPMIRGAASTVVTGGIVATFGLTALALGMFVAVDRCIASSLPAVAPSLTPAIVIGTLASGFIGLFLFDLTIARRTNVPGRRPQGRFADIADALHVHASNGFYLSAGTRILLRMIRNDPAAVKDSAGDLELKPSFSRELAGVLDRVRSRLAMVWPLTDYVAINPYEGIAERNFWDARTFLKSYSDCETLLPLSHYQHHFRAGRFGQQDLQTAITELQRDGFSCVDDVAADQVETLLNAETDANVTTADATPEHRVWTVSQRVDRQPGSDWTATIVDEIGKHCSRHFDRGQAIWRSRWQSRSLWESWRAVASRDLEIEILGLKGFRKLVGSLPSTPEAAIETLLNELEVPDEACETVLLAEFMTIPGWAAWTKYQSVVGERAGAPSNDWMALLAMRLAYDLAVARQTRHSLDWTMTNAAVEFTDRAKHEFLTDAVARLVALRALEIASRSTLLTLLGRGDQRQAASKKSARFQMVFCIDVRSERIRRHLETHDDRLETFGFAGFFGLPIAQTRLGESTSQPQVPALISPAWTVYESAPADVVNRRSRVRDWRARWKSFQRSCIGGFGFVESFGVTYAGQLVRRSLKIGSPTPARDGVEAGQSVSPTRDHWFEQGVDLNSQIDLVQGILRGIGLTSFGRLVAFCGHGSQTENNPLQAGLDCGACGGHSGEFNAKVAAMLLRQPDIRDGLAERGVLIPAETVFIAMLHNTTTDELTIFDADQIPGSHVVDLAVLRDHCRAASEDTRAERGAVAGPSDVRVADAPANWFARSRDWSEVRPEWGLAGNAAFIVGPRSMTRRAPLGGRAFLHSYHAADDPEGAVLEQIMTAPLVVAHWINQQYYASSVDPAIFGSGTKTIHNVVGKFGVVAGNGGDLMTGLPWQSVHDGTSLQHEPMRLQAIIVAPTERIERVLIKHGQLDALIKGGWMHLIAMDEQGVARRFDGQQSWSNVAMCSREKLCILPVLFESTDG